MFWNILATLIGGLLFVAFITPFVYMIREEFVWPWKSKKKGD
jgi:hypothetical protein